ncbi:hypothetical protein BDW02DRAFT_588259 [Decorospora gaudefroyi]|uniref:Cell surface spherulin 4-like protein n=1 Tax=Decorospora gaudefroyi TaxID=184978 RepID=A0A6A5KBK0_9PLEO|nr:hypothetical protein BDW02DRAFT_588259 [Decorospora gaudefroyi]
MVDSGSVIVPLYVYPSAGAWDPVYNIASSYPRINFTAIVNIHNGPGEGALPNAEYSTAIGTLNSLTNVRTIGYVATTWCTKNLSSVLDDIFTYSFWGEYDPSLALNGIFVDETPTQYSPDFVSYLGAIAQAVQDSIGLKDSYIVHNPGALPEPVYLDNAISSEPDLTIIFENSFSNWTEEGAEISEVTQAYDSRRLALLVHSMPDLTANETTSTLQQLLAVGHNIWLTGTSNYTEFDGVLPVFIDCLAALLN